MFKEKAIKFMEKHPKLTGFAVSTACSVPVAVTMATPSIVASAEGDPVATATTSLVTSAQAAFTDAVTQITPVLCTVIGFNVVVRLVRRFIKG
jgi:hypothetical protein